MAYPPEPQLIPTAITKSQIVSNATHNDIIIFSHLRWHHVTQRPQHITKLLSQHHKVLFVEEPIAPGKYFSGTPQIEKIDENLTVLTPRMEWCSWDCMSARYKKIVGDFLDKNTYHNPLFWFYSPNFVNILDAFSPEIVVYDCMDELSKFKFADPKLVQREQKLLSLADVVFTGGKSLYNEKKKYHTNAHCFPSSVDAKHFMVNNKTAEVPSDLAGIPQPIIGFYGVIDERIDFSLLHATATLLPDVSFVMIGPLAKVTEEELPKAKNLHYLGPKNYKELPSYLTQFRVAMMPFARNEATEFISPTKTLEFMAAGKPIVSTPIRDVVSDYSHIVEIADTPASFAHAITHLLNENDSQRKTREQEEAAIVKKTSWKNTVTKMRQIIATTKQTKAKYPLSYSN